MPRSMRAHARTRTTGDGVCVAVQVVLSHAANTHGREVIHLHSYLPPVTIEVEETPATIRLGRLILDGDTGEQSSPHREVRARGAVTVMSHHTPGVVCRHVVRFFFGALPDQSTSITTTCGNATCCGQQRLHAADRRTLSLCMRTGANLDRRYFPYRLHAHAARTGRALSRYKRTGAGEKAGFVGGC